MSAAHLDYETLAELAEGLLDHAEAAAATEHLSGCEVCQEREAELANVSRVLAEAPAPSVPPELISRIDEALAAAAAEQPVDGRPTGEHPRWRRIHVFLAAAAAVGVIVVGGISLVSPLLEGPTAPSSAEGARAPRAIDAERTTTQQTPGSGAQAGPQQAGYPPLRHSGTDYRKAELAGQLAEAQSLSAPKGAQGGQEQGKVAVGPLPERLVACIDGVGKGRVPLLIDLARYEGSPATVIVFAGEGDTLDVWITGPGCGHDDTDLIEHVEVGR